MATNSKESDLGATSSSEPVSKPKEKMAKVVAEKNGNKEHKGEDDDEKKTELLNDSMCKSAKDRFIRLRHWGPIIAVSIVVFISFVSTNAMLQWWPPLQSVWGFLHFVFYFFEFFLVMNNYLSASFIGPGFVPYFWIPENKLNSQFLQYCNFCEAFKPPRAHHCRKCDRCVFKMDHHCPWINTCCGHLNHGFFCYFLFFAPIGCLHSTIILGCSLYKALFVTYYSMLETGEPFVYFGLVEMLMTLFAIGLAVGVVLAVGGLFCVQFKSILKNETGIESWISEKADYRERDPEEPETFVYPYNLGKKNNLRQVFTLSGHTLGNGIDWPLRNGCNEFDLTIEQLRQKRQKNLHSITYRIGQPYSGSIFPVFSFGFRVCCTPPCTDEPRLHLESAQSVRVTRWRKNWLYGQVIDDEPGLKSQGGNKIRRRGWFPRKCAIEDLSRESAWSGDKPDVKME